MVGKLEFPPVKILINQYSFLKTPPKLISPCIFFIVYSFYFAYYFPILLSLRLYPTNMRLQTAHPPVKGSAINLNA